MGACDFARLKKSSKSWNLGSSESLWEKLEYEDDHNFEFSGSAPRAGMQLVGTNHASYRGFRPSEYNFDIGEYSRGTI